MRRVPALDSAPIGIVGDGRVARHFLHLQQKRLVHFSGRLVTRAAEGAHPLMTFGHDLYDLATYERRP